MASIKKSSIKNEDIQNFTKNGFAYVPGAVPREMLDRVDLRDVIFNSYDGLNGNVMQTGWFAELGLDELPSGLASIAENLQSDIRVSAQSIHHSTADWLARISFNEVTIQLYRPGHGETGPHRDQARYGFAFAVLTFKSNGTFCIHADDTPDGERQTWSPSAGDVFLMRPGADGTIHSVPAPHGERITISFRNNSLGPKVGGGGTREFRGVGGLRGSDLGLSAPAHTPGAWFAGSGGGC